MADVEILIAGAGPTGLALALWLAKLGVRVRIVDKTAEPGTTSRAVAVQARTLELYRQVDLADTVVDAGVKVAAANFRTGGFKATRAALGRMGEGLSPFPYALTYPQDAHERLLIERLGTLGVSVERRTELLRFDQDAERVQAVLKRPDGSEEMCQAAYLAGCDGARSTVREALGIGFPGGTYTGLFYVADVDAAGPAANGEIHIDLEQADFLAVFPLKGQSENRLGRGGQAHFAPRAPQSEPVPAGSRIGSEGTGRMRLVGPVSWNPDREGREMTFDDIGQRAIRNLKLTVSKVNWFSTYRVHHRVAARFRERRAFLLGDAAHVHSPVGGQGMNTGIGDAVNLAWKLAAVVKGTGPEELLATYEPERIGFARRLVATTDRVFTIVTKQGAIARQVRTKLFPWVAAALFRVPAVRRLLFRTVSQINVNYRHSPLSTGAAGNVRGGDRLPWIELGDGDGRAADNFEPLNSISWQVHCYGDAPSSVRAVCEARELPLHVFAWRSSMKRAGLKRDAAYLIRPDGYVGLADASGNAAALERYLDQHQIRARP